MKNQKIYFNHKTKAMLIIVALVFFITGCGFNFSHLFNSENTNNNLDSGQLNNINQENIVEYDEITDQANLEDWFDNLKKIDPDFNSDNFQLTKTDKFELGQSYEYKKELNELEKEFYAFAADNERYLDIYGAIIVYEQDGKLGFEAETVEMGPMIPDDFVDPNYRPTGIVNYKQGTKQDFSGVPDNCHFHYAFWLNNNEFVLAGTKVLDEGNVPFLIYYNLNNFTYEIYDSELIPRCSYSGNCPEDMMTLKVYFTGCPDRVTHEHERQVKKTNQVAKAALKELFYGPTRINEKKEGQQYLFDGPEHIEIKDVKIIDDIAYVNLNDFRYIFTYEGPYYDNENSFLRSCQEYAFFEQTTKTLKQFPTIKDAVYFIEGESYLFYDFIGINCPDNLCENNPFQPTMDKTYIYMNCCNDPVVEHIRLIPKGQEKIKSTLHELFKGPKNHERQPINKYYMFNQWTSNILKDIIIVDKIAYVNLADFRNSLTYPDSRCNPPQFFASVGATLTQFPEIDDAIYFIDSNKNTFYNYMGVDCPYAGKCEYNPFK